MSCIYNIIGESEDAIMKKNRALLGLVSLAACVGLLWIGLTGCTTSAGKEGSGGETEGAWSEKLEAPDWDTCEVMYTETDREPYTEQDLQDKVLQNDRGFMIKVKVTPYYQQHVEYDKYEDWNGILKGRCTNYDSLPTAPFYGHAIGSTLAWDSYMLTDVAVEDIYYKGGEISFQEGDTIPLVESYVYAYHYGEECRPEDDFLSLHTSDTTAKLKTGQEYYIIGHLNHRNEYCFMGQNVGTYQVMYNRPHGESEMTDQEMVDYLTELYKSKLL